MFLTMLVLAKKKNPQTLRAEALPKHSGVPAYNHQGATDLGDGSLCACLRLTEMTGGKKGKIKERKGS